MIFCVVSYSFLQSMLEPRIDGDTYQLDLLEFDLNQGNYLDSHVFIDLRPFMQVRVVFEQ